MVGGSSAVYLVGILGKKKSLAEARLPEWPNLEDWTILQTLNDYGLMWNPSVTSPAKPLVEPSQYML